MKILDKCDSIENLMDISLDKQKWNRINWLEWIVNSVEKLELKSEAHMIIDYLLQ